MIDLSKYAEAVNAALSKGAPCIVATAGQDGMPDIGPKGSVLVLDNDHLAYWERTGGQHLANVEQQTPQVAVMYMNLAERTFVRFFGKAELHKTGELRERVMARVVQPELDRDPERKGAAVVIRVDKVIDSFGGQSMSRD